MNNDITVIRKVEHKYLSLAYRCRNDAVVSYNFVANGLFIFILKK